jgi:allantoinase
MIELVVRSRRVLTPGGLAPASLHIEGGRIVALAGPDAIPAGVPVDDLGDAVVMPGLVDTHVHINEPGRTEWEGFASATAAAAAGGITTLVDMPLNSVPPTTSAEALRQKQAAARGHCHVDVGFWAGVVPGNAAELPGLIAAGALGAKCFLIDSGVREFLPVSAEELRPALAVLARLGAPLLCHAELPGPIDQAARALQAGPAPLDARHYQRWLLSRPNAAEDQAVALLCDLCRETSARIHVVHHSSQSALPLLAEARAAGLPISAETCPHYLFFAAEEIPDGATEFKCAPPIRELANREALWRALAAGTLDLVASDHSPCTPALKGRERGDFTLAWGGIAGLQLSLPVVWTAASRRGHDVADLARWMCEAPARLAGLLGRKGRLAPGADADLVAFWPETSFRVDPSRLRHRHPVTPYAGHELRGVVEATYLRGRRVLSAGELDGPPRGQLLPGEPR